MFPELIPQDGKTNYHVFLLPFSYLFITCHLCLSLLISVAITVIQVLSPHTQTSEILAKFYLIACTLFPHHPVYTTLTSYFAHITFLMSKSSGRKHSADGIAPSINLKILKPAFKTFPAWLLGTIPMSRPTIFPPNP